MFWAIVAVMIRSQQVHSLLCYHYTKRCSGGRWVESNSQGATNARPGSSRVPSPIGLTFHVWQRKLDLHQYCTTSKAGVLLLHYSPSILLGIYIDTPSGAQAPLHKEANGLWRKI
jgi:hypothetical protein